MAEAGVIREFLVSLGWNIKRDDQRQFEDALATTKRAALALTATLAGVVAGVAKVAQSYEQMNYAAQRAQSSVGGMQAYAYAISQMGGNADAARASLQNIGNFLRSSPGAEGFIARLGVQTRDAKGNLRDTSAMMADLSKRFRDMPYYRAKATAGLLGIDENTLQAMIRGLGDFGAEYNRIYRSMGVNQEEAAKAGTWFMRQLRETGAVLQVLRDRVAISLMRGVGGDIARLREIIEQNADRISHAMDLAAKFVLLLGTALAQLFARGSEILTSVYDWFSRLDGGTKQWIETIGALLVAWRLLSTGIMATPIGRVIALGVAILGLYDDYKVWKAGGVSLIDWEKWKPGFDALEDALGHVMGIFRTMWPNVEAWTAPLIHFFAHEFVDAFTTLGGVISGISKALDDLVHKRFSDAWQDMKGVYGDLQKSGEEGKQALEDTAKQYLPRGLRNNNPGNIRQWAGAGSDGSFAVFGTPQDGVRAMAQNLRSYINNHHADTIRRIISRWAPSSDGNNTAEYIKHVSQRTGIDPDAQISANDAGSIGKLMDAITRSENGGVNPWREMDYSIARDVTGAAGTVASNASPSPPITINQTNNIHGAKDPHETATAVVTATNGAGNSIVRNLKARRT